MHFTIHTDGGCSGNKRDAGCRGAWAYLVQNQAGIIIHHDSGAVENTTNNRMELMAAISALSSLTDKKLHDCLVITDSQYVVNNYEDYFQEWKRRGWRKSAGGLIINDDLWKSLDRLIPEFKSVKFQWVRGHAGDKLNQMADTLVRSILYPTK